MFRDCDKTHYYRFNDFNGPTPEQQAIEQLQEDVERIEQEIANSNHHEHFMLTPAGSSSPTVYYLNATSGDDDNDGLSENKPKKHLYALLDILNKKETGMYITFTDTQDTVYDAIDPTSPNQRIYMTSVLLAIVNRTNHKITITWGDSVLWNNSYYYCYGNATSPIVNRYNRGGYPDFTGDYRGHFDNSFMNWSYATDEGFTFGLHSCHATFSNVGCNRFFAEESFVRSTGTFHVNNVMESLGRDYNNPANSQKFAIRLICSNATFGAIKVSNLDSDAYIPGDEANPDDRRASYNCGMIQAHDSTILSLQYGTIEYVSTGGRVGKYPYGLTSSYSEVIVPSDKLTAIGEMGYRKYAQGSQATTGNAYGINGSRCCGAGMSDIIVKSRINEG